MQQTIPTDVVEVFDADHLKSVLESAEFGVDVTDEEAERIVSLVDGNHPDIICTTWSGFCYENLGETDGPNRFVLADIDYERSEGKRAWIVEKGLVIKADWLKSGNGNMNKCNTLDMTEGNEQFDGWDELGQGSFPKDYVFAAHADPEMYDAE